MSCLFSDITGMRRVRGRIAGRVVHLLSGFQHTNYRPVFQGKTIRACFPAGRKVSTYKIEEVTMLNGGKPYYMDCLDQRPCPLVGHVLF